MSNFDDVISCCRDLLINFPEAKEISSYADGRLSKAGQEKFSFGYFPTNKNLQTLISVVGEDKLGELELIYPKLSEHRERHSSMENHNLIMPYRDVYGNIIAIVGRTILDDDQRKSIDIPKYKNTAFKKGNHLFGLYESKDSIISNNLIFVVEGQFDCISAHDKGLTNIVALGSSSMTFDQFALILRYTNNIVLLLDNDEAGRLGTERILKLYSKHANIKRAGLPKGYKDICEYLSDNSIEDLNLVLR